MFVGDLVGTVSGVWTLRFDAKIKRVNVSRVRVEVLWDSSATFVVGLQCVSTVLGTGQ